MAIAVATLAATRIAVAQTTHTMWLAANAHGVAAPILRIERAGGFCAEIARAIDG